MNRERIVRNAPLGALLIALCIGCGPSPVPLSSVPHPETEQAIDKNSPGFKKLQEDARKFGR